ncbi:MAG: hypothetical protein PHY47_25825, partial [Lachnospiraceae bacterium]|nr:hypothetical protein [Lachnospiraceae bacterium]
MKRLYKFTSVLLIVLILSNCFLGDYLTIKTYALTQNEYDEITEENLKLAKIIEIILGVAGMTCGVTPAVGIAGVMLGAGFGFGSISIDKDGYIEFDQEMFNLIQAKTDDYFNQTHYYGEFPSDYKGKVAYTVKSKLYSTKNQGSDTFISSFNISTRTAIYLSGVDNPHLVIAYYTNGAYGSDGWSILQPLFTNGYYSWARSTWYYNDVTVATNLPLFSNEDSMQNYLYTGDDSGALNKEFRPYNFNLIPHSATTPSNYRVQVYTPTVSENNTPSENDTPSENNTPSQNKPYEPISFNDVPPSGNQITTDNIDYTSRFDYIIKQLKNLIDNVNNGFKTVVDKLNNNKANTVSPNIINNYISNNNISNNNIYNYVSSNSSGVSSNSSVS